jgi:hypothetical protein
VQTNLAAPRSRGGVECSVAELLLIGFLERSHGPLLTNIREPPRRRFASLGHYSDFRLPRNTHRMCSTTRLPLVRSAQAYRGVKCVGLLFGFCTQSTLRLSTGSPPCYPEPGDQTHLNTVRQVPVFRGLGRQCSWKEGWK